MHLILEISQYSVWAFKLSNYIWMGMDIYKWRYYKEFPPHNDITVKAKFLTNCHEIKWWQPTITKIWWGQGYTQLLTNHSDVIWRSWHLKSPATGLFAQQHTQIYNNDNVKSQHNWLYVIGIHQLPMDCPRKGSVIQKCFHVVMSSLFNTTKYLLHIRNNDTWMA